MRSGPARIARTAAAILLIASLVAALCTALLLPYYLARWWSSIPLRASVSVLSCFLIFWPGARISARVWGARHSGRLASRAAGVLAPVFFALLFDPQRLLYPVPPFEAHHDFRPTFTSLI